MQEAFFDAAGEVGEGAFAMVHSCEDAVVRRERADGDAHGDLLRVCIRAGQGVPVQYSTALVRDTVLHVGSTAPKSYRSLAFTTGLGIGEAS
jgi:hypothetical protein